MSEEGLIPVDPTQGRPAGEIFRQVSIEIEVVFQQQRDLRITLGSALDRVPPGSTDPFQAIGTGLVVQDHIDRDVPVGEGQVAQRLITNPAPFAARNHHRPKPHIVST